MKTYFCRKIVNLFLVLIGVSLISFTLSMLSPGDPAELILSQNGVTYPTYEQIQELREQLGLNRPYHIQYMDWLRNILQGDLGTTYMHGVPVIDELCKRFPVTAGLAIFSILLASINGIFLGCISAVKSKGLPDMAIKTLTNVLFALPSFWIALIMIYVFSEKLKWLPTSNVGSFEHYIMPSVILSLGVTATVCRMTNTALLNEFSKEYFWLGKARGISSYKMIVCNALPNVMLPVIAAIGNSFGSVLGGAAIIESIFAIPGLGRFALEAISMRDYPALQGYVIFSGVIYVTVTFFVDSIIAFLNPKIRLDGLKNE